MKNYILIMLGLCTSIYAIEPIKKIEVPTRYYDRLISTCATYAVPTTYMAKLIQYESGFDPYCINKNSNGTVDRGIMQFNSAGMKDLSRWHYAGLPIDPFDWEVSMEVGVKHFRYMYEKTGSWWGAVIAYNMGYQGFLDFVAGKRPLPSGTKKELDFVFS